MRAIDFEYDGVLLSDYGMIICDFNGGSGVTEVESGSVLTFNKVSTNGGKKHLKESFIYDQCITSTFDICKNDEIYSKEEMRITQDEFREISRWLNRKEFHKFHAIYKEDYEEEQINFNATFNISKLKIGDILYGIRVTMETDAPFGYGEKYTTELKMYGTNKVSVYDSSDEVGDIFPELEITCNSNGTLKITNETNGCICVVYNCSQGETIKIDNENKIISSNFESHDICDDFNYEFFKLSNSLDTRENIVSASLPCTMTISYTPIIKDSL